MMLILHLSSMSRFLKKTRATQITLTRNPERVSSDAAVLTTTPFIYGTTTCTALMCLVLGTL